jgi:BirA family biotin operon repressor/biotin-[acetyl-CoA-carboxylase] ligase
VALLLSAGFRPRGLEPAHAWQLGAIVGLAMLDAADAIHGTAVRALALKWPNDLVARRGDGVAKVGGVLGESVIDDGSVATAIVGIGVNADWPIERFPPELAASMSSLRQVVGGPVDRELLLMTFLERLAAGYEALASGTFPAMRWSERQVTTGARVELDLGNGHREQGTAIGVDTGSGGLLLRGDDGTVRTHLTGDVVRCRVEAVGRDV